MQTGFFVAARAGPVFEAIIDPHPLLKRVYPTCGYFANSMNFRSFSCFFGGYMALNMFLSMSFNVSL